MAVAPGSTATPPAPTIGSTAPTYLGGKPPTVLTGPTGTPTVVGGGLNFGSPSSTTIIPTGLTADQSSAKALLDSFFGMVGLQSLGDWAWQKYLAGDSVNQIMLEAKGTDAYKARFPAMAGLEAKGEAITEAAYISYETGVKQLLQAHGIVSGMYDTPEAIAKMLLGNVSMDEATSRVQLAAYAAYTAPQSVRDALHSQFGPGSLTSMYLDDTKALPLLQQQLAAAQVMGGASEQGIGISADQAAALAAQGINYGQAQQGFGQVAETAGLGAGLGETADQATRTAAIFGNGPANQQMQRVIKGRLAQFGGGGNAVEGSGGVSGLGPNSA